MEEKKKTKTGIIVLIVSIVLIILLVSIYIIIKKPFTDHLYGNENNTVTNNIVENNSGELLTEINGFKTEDHYYIDKIVKKSDGTETGYIVCELDGGHYERFKTGMCVSGTMKYYSIASQEYSKVYDEVYDINDKYINAGYCTDSNSDTTCYADILDIETGKTIKTLDGVAVYEEKIGNMISYKISNSMGDSCYTLLNESFEKVLGNYEAYAYEINTDNTITILTSDMFIVYDFDGNQKYLSKKYTEAIMVGQDTIIVNDNGTINALDNQGNVKKQITTVEGDWHSSQTDGNSNCYDDGNCEIYLYKNNEDKSMVIEYNLKDNTFNLQGVD